MITFKMVENDCREIKSQLNTITHQGISSSELDKEKRSMQNQLHSTLFLFRKKSAGAKNQ